MSDCLFCRIAAGPHDAGVLHSSDRVVAFRDVNPQAPTHLLLIPREHVASVADLTGSHDGVLAEVFEVIRSLAERESLDTGYRVVTNVGVDAGQSVDHLHFHLLGGRAQLSHPSSSGAAFRGLPARFGTRRLNLRGPPTDSEGPRAFGRLRR